MPENLCDIPGTWFIGQDQFTVDYEVQHTPGKPSFRIDKGVYPRNINLSEIHNIWLPTSQPFLKAGDRIFMTCWAKLDAADIHFEEPQLNGAIIGFDLYGDRRLWEVHSRKGDINEIWTLPEWAPGGSRNFYNRWYVPFGSDWRKLTVDIVLPDKVFTVNDYGQPIPAQPAIGLIPWLTTSWRDHGRLMDNSPNPATAWFADCELYINPAVTPPQFCCELCPKCYATQAELDQHFQDAHVTIPPPEYCCPYCEPQFCFDTQAELDAHMEQVHPTPEPTPTIPAAVFAPIPLLLNKLCILRNKVFTEEQHRKLHPLI